MNRGVAKSDDNSGEFHGQQFDFMRVHAHCFMHVHAHWEIAVTAPTTQHQPGSGDTMATGVWCCEVELGGVRDCWAPVAPEPLQGSSRVLVRLHGEPLGYLTVPGPPTDIDIAAVKAMALVEFAARVRDHLAAEGLDPSATFTSMAAPAATASCPNRANPTGLVSVVVCTRNRSDILRSCLDRLAQLTYPEVEILIVDNAPSDDSTVRLVEHRRASDPRFRYVREPRPGLSAARNRGVAEATGDYIAYTDDDVSVDPGWVQGLLLGFCADPAVGCVTGLVCTAGIGSAAEAYFDARSPSWSSRVEPEMFDLADHRRDSGIYPYSAGIFGTGANFAFRRQTLAAVGSFDEALGAGTPTRGGEDLDMFVRVLRGGYAISYQPAAIVWHHHRADDQALNTQMFGYGAGLTAYLTKCLLGRGTGREVLVRIPGGALKMLRIRRQTAARLPASVRPPSQAWKRELAGMAAGSWLYWRSRRRGTPRPAQPARPTGPGRGRSV